MIIKKSDVMVYGEYPSCKSQIVEFINSFDKSNKILPSKLEIEIESFVLINHEFITDLVDYLDGEMIQEVCCGTGFLSHWLKQYGARVMIPTDRGVGQDMDRRFSNPVAGLIEKKDAVQTVKESSANIVIIGWPDYGSPIDLEVFEAMRPGQKLIVIGEGSGGCTSCERAIETMEPYEIETNLNRNFVRFSGIRDNVSVYERKVGNA